MKTPYDKIPEELRALPNWVVWRLEKRRNKQGIVRETKVPYNAHARTEKCAESDNPDTWSSFGDAIEALKRDRGYGGIGLNLTRPYVGVDLDGCRQTGGFEPWASDIIRELDSYSELSPSRLGVHVIAKGELPDGRRQKEFKDREHHGVGLYDATRGRYLTVTGCRLRGSTVIAERTAELRQIHARLFPPKPPQAPQAKPDAAASTSDDELIARARQANDGGKFSRLWDGNWKGAYETQSQADLALCTKLAFWTNDDASRIDALFRQSQLMRDKWDRKDYRDGTIAKAIDRTTATRVEKSPIVTPPSPAVIDLGRFPASLDLLNGLTVWQGRIQFVSVKRRGPMLIGSTSDDAEVVWPSTAELGNFSKTQAIISDSTNIWIPTPPPRQIRAQWEPAVSLLLQLSAEDGLRLEPALKEEIRDLLRLVWRAAHQPAAQDSGHFIDFMRAVQRTRRNPRWGLDDIDAPRARPDRELPPCVFIAEGSAWVHVPSFRMWLSIPALTNKQPPLADVRNGLLLLGFTYCENLTRRKDGDSETACLWRGPLEVLEG